jgi:predicted amino acid dehydrogenase
MATEEEGGIMNQRKYTTETKTTTLQGKVITITHLTPILTPEEREKQKREIEQKLFEVYSKYENGGHKAA